MEKIKLIGSAPNQVSRNRDLGNLAFQNKESVRIDDLVVDSNVGIGTTTVSRGPLHINQNSTADCNIHLTNNTSGTSNADGFTIYTTGLHAGFVNREANGYINFITNDAVSVAERMRITAAGNVGIGTSAPVAKLEVRGSSESVYMIAGGDNTNNNGRALEFSSFNAGSVGSGHKINAKSSNGAITFAITDTERLRIDSSGNVGIGTSSPASRLHVSNAGNIADGCFNVSTPANDNVLIGANLVVDAAGTYTKPASNISGAGILFEGINSINAHGSIQFLSAPDTNSTSATPLERMRIDSSGNVLVGKTTSASGETNVGTLLLSNGRLGVTHASNNSWFSRTTTDGDVLKFHRGTSTTVGSISVTTTSTAYNVSSTQTGMVGDSSSVNIVKFQTNGNERMRIDSSGNVGIGTNAPAARLHIVGERIRIVAGALGTNVTVADRDLQIGGVEVRSTSGRSSFVSIVDNNFTAVNTNAAFQHLFPFNENVDLYAFRSSIGTVLTDTFWVKQRGDAYFSGNVGIGTSSPATKLDVAGTVTATTFSGALTGNASTATTLQTARAINGTNFDGSAAITTANWGAARTLTIGSTGKSVNGSENVAWSAVEIIPTTTNFQINSLGVGTAASGTTGEIRATNNITAYFSDDRLKTKLGDIENALEKLCSLSGFYYEANETAQALGYKPVREVGVSAQQVQAVLPEVVKPAPIDDQYLTVQYEKMIPLLIEAIKELNAKIDKLGG